MLLYHGTSDREIERILEDGIRPRSTHKVNNWGHSCESNPNAVYLTNAYALYFAWAATRDDERLVVLEVDTSFIEHQLCADEDVLEQATRGKDELPPGWGMKRRTTHYRKRIANYSWVQSLSTMGNCAHLGVIPPEAITRLAYVRRDVYLNMIMMGHDPTISIPNYQIVGNRYRAVMTWLFDPHLLENPVIENMGYKFSLYPIPDSRDGIEVKTAKITTMS